jgi:Na+-driven multidrug efflux pump
LEAPIGITLLKLGAPNVLVMFVQTSVGLIETYLVGWLGTDALADPRTEARCALVREDA